MKKETLSDNISNSTDESHDDFNFKSQLSDYIFQEVLNCLDKNIKETKNSLKIKQILHLLLEYILESVYPYLYTILFLLIIMFIMNCTQMYYIIIT